MEGEVLKLIMENGIETAILAVAINVLTGLLKLPIKAWAKKLEDGTKVTRYLVFLPIILGFGLTAIYIKFRSGELEFDKSFATLWLTSSSLSLSLYAIFEKMFPTKDKVLKDYEVEANEKLLKEIRRITGIEGTEQQEKSTEKKEEKKKIILKGKRDEETQTEKQSI